MEIIQVEGLDKDGNAIITAELTPSISVSSAKLILNGSVHSQITSPFTGGTFTLSLDQNNLNFITSNTLVVEVDLGNSICTSNAFTCTPQSSAMNDQEVLNFFFLTGGVGLKLFPSTLIARSKIHTWSIPSTGYTNVVPALFPGNDSVSTVVDFNAFVISNISYTWGGKMSWIPNGPVKNLAGPPRFIPIIGTNSENFVAETGTNWWFVPGGGATGNVVIEIFAGNVGGIATPNNQLDVIFP